MKIRWTIRHHAIAWLSVFAFALAYLASLIYFPPNGDRLAGETKTVAETAKRDGTPQTPPGFRRASGKDGPLAGRSEKALRSEIAVLRKQLEVVDRREQDLRQRLTALESALGPNTASLPPQAAEEPSTTGSLEETKSVPQPLPNITVEFSDLPEDGFGDTLIDTSPLPIAGARTSTRTLFGVELASGATPDALHKKWAALGARHKALLGGLEARHTETGTADAEGAAEIRLIAGPFPNAADAALLCARLRAAGADCREAVFTGESF